MSRPLHARWILPVVVVVAGFAIWHQVRALDFRVVAPGMEFALLRGEPYCRRGSAAIAVLRVDPAITRLRVRHRERSSAQRLPPSVVEWQRETGAPVVFNAGQYYPDHRYMGLLVAGGEVVSRKLHPDFQAALVASPKGGGPEARVLDLSREPLDPDAPGWAEVAQSFMLFDSSGAARVKRSDRVANRTVVAEDRHGRLLVFVTEGGYTLADLATVLQRSPLDLSHAMSMDGGLEAEMVVATRAFRYASFGAWPEAGDANAPGARTPLPSVITLEPR